MTVQDVRRLLCAALSCTCDDDSVRLDLVRRTLIKNTSSFTDPEYFYRGGREYFRVEVTPRGTSPGTSLSPIEICLSSAS